MLYSYFKNRTHNSHTNILIATQNLSLALLLGLWPLQAQALEQYWTEERNGVNHACYSPGFWAMIGGNRTCAPYSGDTPPDRRALRVQAVAPADELRNYTEVTRRIEAMQRERATTQRNIQEIETRISGLNPCQNVPFNEHGACLRRSSAEFERILPQITAERARIQQQQQQARALDEGLAQANLTARQEEDRARLANQIIANKDVLARLDRLDGRLDIASGTLESIERAFNRSLLEAYISQKMNKMSANLCEASALCASSPREAPQRLMNRVFDEERIKNDARNPRAPQTRQ
jgi:hypothetical protein